MSFTSIMDRSLKQRERWHGVCGVPRAVYICRWRLSTVTSRRSCGGRKKNTVRGTLDTLRRAGQAQARAHLIDVTLAAGVHGLAVGTLATQLLDVPQKALDCLVLR